MNSVIVSPESSKCGNYILTMMWNIQNDPEKLYFPCYMVNLGNFSWKNSNLPETSRNCEFRVFISQNGIMIPLPIHGGIVNSFVFPSHWIDCIYFYAMQERKFFMFLEINQSLVNYIKSILGRSNNWTFPFLERDADAAPIVGFFSSELINPRRFSIYLTIIETYYKNTKIKMINEHEAEVLIVKSRVRDWVFKKGEHDFRLGGYFH